MNILAVVATVNSRRDDHTEATRRALLDAATGLFAEKGYSRTSLEEIATAARVTKGAIYHHFASKTTLFEAAIERLEVVEAARMREAYDQAPDAAAGAQAVLDVFLSACSDPIYGGVVFREGPVALGWERWHECEQKYNYAVIEYVIAGLTAEGRVAVPLSETFLALAFGMLGAAGQLLARAPRDQLPRLQEECRVPFLALLTGLSAMS